MPMPMSSLTQWHRRTTGRPRGSGCSGSTPREHRSHSRHSSPRARRTAPTCRCWLRRRNCGMRKGDSSTECRTRHGDRFPCCPTPRCCTCRRNPTWQFPPWCRWSRTRPPRFPQHPRLSLGPRRPWCRRCRSMRSPGRRARSPSCRTRTHRCRRCPQMCPRRGQMRAGGDGCSS